MKDSVAFIDNTCTDADLSVNVDCCGVVVNDTKNIDEEFYDVEQDDGKTWIILMTVIVVTLQRVMIYTL